MLEAGHHIGAVRVESKLGAGATGTVWLVRDPTGAASALKVLHLESLAARTRFRREADILGSLDHPHVVRLYEVLDVGGFPALRMEFVEGLSLSALLAREALEPAVLDQLFAQALAGVGAAHAAGLVHRDLKPQNLLVGNLGGLRVLKVSDFGLASVPEGTLDPRLTMGNVPLGTPSYMAPEQLFDPRLADARSDVFALGCVWFEMVCGRRALDRAYRAERMPGRSHPDPRVLAPRLGDAHAALMLACLSPLPDDRPADARELAERFGVPVVAAAPPASPEHVGLGELAGLFAPPPPPALRTVTPRTER